MKKILIALMFCVSFNAAATEILKNKMSIAFVYPDILRTQEGLTLVTIPGVPLVGKAGAPLLPMKSVYLAAPMGYVFEDINVIPVGENIIGSFTMKRGSYKRPFSVTGPSRDAVPLDGVFPMMQYSQIQNQRLHGFNFRILNIYPITHRTIDGITTFTPEFEIELTYRKVENTEQRKIRTDDYKRVLELADNSGFVARRTDNEAQVGRFFAEAEYVIITDSDLAGSNDEWNLQKLIEKRESEGLSGRIVTVEDIYENYEGTDNQDKIRNFIRFAYENWGTRFVLLAGDADASSSGQNIVPVRGMHAEAEGYVDKTIPSDMYYACLDGTFDHNGNGIYGDPDDGVEGGEVDLLAEIYIGRATVGDRSQLSNFVRKTLAYDSLTGDEDYLNDIVFAGEYLWETDDGVKIWGSDHMEELKISSNAHGIVTTGYPENYRFHDLYDKNSTFTDSALIRRINEGAHVINHLGHASTSMVMKLYASDLSSITNDDSSLLLGYTQGCYAGSFDNKSSWWATGDAIIERFITAPNMAFAFIGNTRYGWGDDNSTRGPSHRYHRQFVHAFFNDGIKKIGMANQYSKEKNIGMINETAMRWVCYELTLFGDPAQDLKIRTN